MAVPAIFDVRVLRGSDYYRDRLRERAGRRALVQCRRNPTPAGTAFDAIPAPGHHRPAIDSDLVRGAREGARSQNPGARRRGDLGITTRDLHAGDSQPHLVPEVPFVCGSHAIRTSHADTPPGSRILAPSHCVLA